MVTLHGSTRNSVLLDFLHYSISFCSLSRVLLNQICASVIVTFYRYGPKSIIMKTKFLYYALTFGYIFHIVVYYILVLKHTSLENGYVLLCVYNIHLLGWDLWDVRCVYVYVSACLIRNLLLNERSNWPGDRTGWRCLVASRPARRWLAGRPMRILRMNSMPGGP
jgi:hypothetical protein